MEKPYTAPFVEFVGIEGDALQGSTEQSAENREVDVKGFFINPGTDDWFVF